MLEYNMQELGKSRNFAIHLLRSPKCHPEVAGEGVEYNIAHAKIYIRSIPWQSRSNIRVYQNYVKLAFSRNEGAKISEDRSIAFSRRARDYIVAYYILHGCANRKVGETAKDFMKHITTLHQPKPKESKESREDKSRRSHFCEIPMNMIENMRKT